MEKEVISLFVKEGKKTPSKNESLKICKFIDKSKNLYQIFNTLNGIAINKYILSSMLSNCNLSLSFKKILFRCIPRSILDYHHFGIAITVFSSNFYSECRKIFDEVLQENMLDNVIVSNYINCASRIGDLYELKRAFYECRKKGCIDTHVYNLYIQHVGRLDIEETRYAFHDAIKNGYASDRTYSNYISVENMTGNFDIVRETFKIACERKMASFDSYITYIEMLIASDLISEASRVFVSLNLDIVTKDQNSFTVDIHLLGPNVGYLAIKLLLDGNICIDIEDGEISNSYGIDNVTIIIERNSLESIEYLLFMLNKHYPEYIINDHGSTICLIRRKRKRIPE